MNIEGELKKIKDEIIACKKCSLYKYRNENRFYPVVGEGNHQAKIMFVGEAPGLNEARTGRPFCGAAGRVLDELLDFAGIKRKEIYISNLVKCRPPQNRDPQKEEIEFCLPYIERQIKIIRPKLICTLGRFSMQFLMEKFGLEKLIQPISTIHGNVFESKDFIKGIKIIPFYHPAVAVYNPKIKDVLKRDFKILSKFGYGIKKISREKNF